MPKKWRREVETLTAKKDLQYQDMWAMWEELKAVETLRKAAEKLAKEQPDQTQKMEYHEL